MEAPTTPLRRPAPPRLARVAGASRIVTPATRIEAAAAHPAGLRFTVSAAIAAALISAFAAYAGLQVPPSDLMDSTTVRWMTMGLSVGGVLGSVAAAMLSVRLWGLRNIPERWRKRPTAPDKSPAPEATSWWDVLRPSRSLWIVLAVSAALWAVGNGIIWTSPNLDGWALSAALAATVPGTILLCLAMAVLVWVQVTLLVYLFVRLL